ncbi:MAG: hypothetical protein GX131_18590, partial [candidate division WS1 bacterium]|nr:hypothetical protein [candidate division WS1 bacterium]
MDIYALGADQPLVTIGPAGRVGLGAGSCVWEPAAATPEGIYTYRIRAAHDEEGGCDDQ